MHIGNHEANKEAFIYEQDKGWNKYTSVPSLPRPDGLYRWYLSASGDDNYLVVADDSKLLVFDGQQWQQRDGPKHKNIMHNNILIHCGTLYLQENWGDSFYKISVQFLLAENDYDWEMIKPPRAYASDIEYSSLTLVGDHVTMVASIYSGLGMSRMLCILSLSSISNSWIALTQPNLDRCGIPSIVGCPNGTLFLMGLKKTKDPRPHNLSSTRVLRQLKFSDQQVATIPQFKMIKLAPNGMLPREKEGEYPTSVWYCVTL